MAVVALDDLWAQPASRDAFMSGYRNVDWQKADIDPHQAGMGPIGHMGYFKAACAPLWANALHWLEQHGRVPGAGISR
jgi:predicted alpha/beta hydrolase